MHNLNTGFTVKVLYSWKADISNEEGRAHFCLWL